MWIQASEAGYTSLNSVNSLECLCTRSRFLRCLQWATSRHNTWNTGECLLLKSSHKTPLCQSNLHFCSSALRLANTPVRHRPTRWETTEKDVSQRKSHFNRWAFELAKGGCENRVFNPKWTDLHSHSTGWQFKNCLKSETQVIIEGHNLKQTTNDTITVIALNLTVPLVKTLQISYWSQKLGSIVIHLLKLLTNAT